MSEPRRLSGLPANDNSRLISHDPRAKVSTSPRVSTSKRSSDSYSPPPTSPPAGRGPSPSHPLQISFDESEGSGGKPKVSADHSMSSSSGGRGGGAGWGGAGPWGGGGAGGGSSFRRHLAHRWSIPNPSSLLDASRSGSNNEGLIRRLFQLLPISINGQRVRIYVAHRQTETGEERLLLLDVNELLFEKWAVGLNAVINLSPPPAPPNTMRWLRNVFAAADRDASATIRSHQVKGG